MKSLLPQKQRGVCSIAAIVVLLLIAGVHAGRVAEDARKAGVSSPNATASKGGDPSFEETAADAVPLALWLTELTNIPTVPPCVILEAGGWGLGSSLNTMLWTAAILRQRRPDVTIYYDHSPSTYQCRADGSIEAMLQPANTIVKSSTPPEGCVRKSFMEAVQHTEGVLMRALQGMITETTRRNQMVITDPQQRLQRHLLLDATFQALCPVVSDWWHLTPELQLRADAVKRQLQSRQRPVIAIHARGGDKARELGKYYDSVTKQYPMAEGMRRLIATHPAIPGSSPTCILFGDDFKYAQAVKQMAQKVLQCGEVVMRTPEERGTSYDIKDFRAMAQSARCQATKDYLVDIELMGWANFMVANHRANADTTAAFLRKCKYYYDYSTVVPGTGASSFTLWA